MKRPLKQIYRTARSVVFTTILTVVGLFALLCVLLAMPPVQDCILDVACREVSVLLGGKVNARSLSISLFDEVILHDVSLTSPEGECVIEVGTLGAGIDLWHLLREGRIEITYAEILDLEGHLRVAQEGGPLNIQFMIDALAPKDKTKPPTKFDLNIRTVIVRRGHVTFDREWMPRVSDTVRLDFNHLDITGLTIDMNIPRMRNDDFLIHLRRLAFDAEESLSVKRLSCEAEISPRRICARGLRLEMPRSELSVSDIELPLSDGFRNIRKSLLENNMTLRVESEGFVPADLRAFLPILDNYNKPLHLLLDVSGTMRHVDLRELSVGGADGFSLSMEARASGFDSIRSALVDLRRFELEIPSPLLLSIAHPIGFKPNVISAIKAVSNVGIRASGQGDLDKGAVTGEVHINTGAGRIDIRDLVASGLKKEGIPSIKGEVSVRDVSVGNLLGEPRIGHASFEGSGRVRLPKGRIPDVDADITVDYVDWSGYRLRNVEASLLLDNGEGNVDLFVEDPSLNLRLEASGDLSGKTKALDGQVFIGHFIPSSFGFLTDFPGYTFSGYLGVDAEGSGPDDLIGTVDMSNLRFASSDKAKSILLNHFEADCTIDDEGTREVNINSDLIDGYVAGNYKFLDIVPTVKNMLSTVIPTLVPVSHQANINDGPSFDFNFTIHSDHEVLDFFKLPLRPLTDVTVKGSLDAPHGMAEVEVKAPYLQQGRNKLVTGTAIRGVVDSDAGTANVVFSTTMPVKFGEMTLDVTTYAHDDQVSADIGWRLPDTEKMSGSLGLDASFERNYLSGTLNLDLNVDPSDFIMNGARWRIGGGHIGLNGHRFEVDDLLVSHEDQFVRIGGIASQYPEDQIDVSLANIDVGYIFDTLNINYVTFGGIATGELAASSLFSKTPQASTRRLEVKGLSYNGAVLGDADISSRFDPARMMVGINADIREDGHRAALLDGGIWVTRDSLSFGVDADHVNVEFLRPFMAAFSSGLEGRASGRAKLYGTFKDIDLEGRLYADTIRMKLDFTNTWYSGSDSVYIDRGRITIPGFRIYDRDGNSGVFSGELTHKFFREPEFDFRLREARNLLCYDTDARINPDWYGTMYGDGVANIVGRPGLVAIGIDMTTCPGSCFTMVLNDTQAAEDYRFLSFSDRRRAAAEALKPDTVPEFLKRFRRQVSAQEESPTNVKLDIRASVTPGAMLTLVMDPAGGDKITARGSGAMQMEYESESNEMKMFGRYTLDEGNYNFSLQDIILKDFVIRPGSSISFNGDPMNADLDIAATYRVNTNLTDLDKSFATDRELNRTNVPVDAVLMVRGQMTTPDITFDIDLPTLTEDVGRKVRSIISTNDMMSRQIIYLLALNRFYTPEYTGTSSASGSEFSALASSTLSSQLSNVLSTLTDKLTVSPSIRSDKGDFSDVEMDLALSSRLLNNRLLINGNFGYRDRNTSSTTFIGDFDIEYLLTRSGNLRLKAYNHFNDQNYYLRSALTTQGIGVVLRHEFDSFRSFLRRKEADNPCATLRDEEDSNDSEDRGERKNKTKQKDN